MSGVRSQWKEVGVSWVQETKSRKLVKLVSQWWERCIR